MTRSPLHEIHANHGARFVDFGGWEMPVDYGSVLAEHRAVRSTSGVFDVTHLGRFQLSGPGARQAIDHLLSNDLARITPGRTQYTLMLNDDGGILDDLIVWWWEDSQFWVLPNAANHHRVMTIFSQQPGCELTDLRSQSVMLAVQGPGAPAILESVLGLAPARFRTARGDFQGREVFVAGTGYTGERGGELCTDPETGQRVFEAILQAGAAPCGLGARDTLRLETGLPLWGADIDESTNPYQAGLGFAVSSEREFVGSEAINRLSEARQTRALQGFVLDEKGVPRHGFAMRSREAQGVVTSGNLSPILGIGVGLGYLSPPLPEGTPVEVEIRSRWVAATRIDPPFHRT